MIATYTNLQGTGRLRIPSYSEWIVYICSYIKYLDVILVETPYLW